MNKLTIRQDDFDFRMTPEFYIAVHEHFIVNDLIETAVVQMSQHGRLPDYEKKMELIEYMNTAPNWDIQLHGWSHDHYHEMKYDEIIRDISSAMYWCGRLFRRYPTVWYPPYNVRNGEMERAAKMLGLEINNESCGIKDFVLSAREGEIKTNSFYFHGWKNTEMEYFEEMIELVKEVQS